jgi:hypothetical protein
MGSRIKLFDEFVNENLNDNITPEERDELYSVGLEKREEFRDWFSVLDFFGGEIPGSYNKAKREALDAGYDLPMDLWQEALMNSLDGNSDAEMYEATAAEVASQRAAIEQEEATVAKAKADLAAKKATIKPEQADALNLKAQIEAEEAKLAQQEAEIAKKKDLIAKTPVAAQ